MRKLLVSTIFITVLLCACAQIRPTRTPTKILFVGNSLIYVGNLPSVFDALAASNGEVVLSDMIVKGGATLSDRVADGSVDRALSEKRYDYVVLQERGGDVLCAFGPKSCENAKTSLGLLARIARKHGARPVSLGTYQMLPQASTGTVVAEAAIASRLSIPYISVSDRFQMALAYAPAADWLFSDGAHPGHDLTLLEAVLIYQEIFGALPKPDGFAVSAPMYKPNARFSLLTPLSHELNPHSPSPSYEYSAKRVSVSSEIASRSSP